LESYITIKERASFEYEDRKSVFIADAAPVSCEADALAFLEYVKKKYPDARHHVYAYVLRENSIMRFSDDREPQGTAGMPTLDAIRKNGCTDTAIVTIRYFGGTLLGTGGLVRAYSAAACGAVNNAKIITYDLYTALDITVSYSDYQKITPYISDQNFRVKETKYLDSVIIIGSISSANVDDFIKRITETTSGRAEIQKIEENFEY
jgi:uncharacterized YigZ family protein